MSRIVETLARGAATGETSIALSDESMTYDYTSLYAEVKRIADLLREKLPGGDPVAIVADNSCAWAILDLAFVFLNRPLVPLPSFFTARQRQSALNRVGAKWLISDTGPAGESVIEIARRRFHVTGLKAPSIELPPGTTKITFTSGTTGEPKGVCLSQGAMERVSRSLVETIGRDKAGIHLPVLPLSVLLENVAGLYTTLLAGGHYRALSQSSVGFAKPFEPDFNLLVNALAEQRIASVDHGT